MIMRFWDLSGPEVEAADAAPWDGPLASTMRPFSTRGLVRLYVASSVLYMSIGVVGVVTTLSAPSGAANRIVWLATSIYALAGGVGLFITLAMVSPRTLRRFSPAVAFGSLMVSTIVLTVAVAAAGPRFAILAATYIEAPLFAFYMLRRRWAVVCVALCLLGFGLVVGLQDGWEAPFDQWLILLATVIATGFLMGIMAERSDRLAESEHEARMALGELNHTLEERVAEQVGEIEHLGQLRRFLSPQVADAVLSVAAEQLTRPHRQRIAVFFCDLRGFTAFTNQAEPEEVVGVLDEYYHAVGGLLQQYDATVGDYAGDGIMAYFGDPVPREEAALAAVEMTRELCGVMVGVVADWDRRGYQISYGVGLAHGYATLGVVGFDGRYDYKPMGGVVNLASRLCGQAAAGQVLLDHATHAATTERFASTHYADLDLKGYGAATRAYALTDPMPA
jgi:class 3 adenylate cyclase